MSQLLPKVEFFTGQAKLIADREQTVDVLIRITPPQPESAAMQRPKLNLSMVLDRSGSMKGQKMERAREATAFCIDQLLPTDRLSVVIFDDQIEVLIPSQQAENAAELKERLSRVSARNSTALHQAWVNGGIQVSEHTMEEGINRVLLITDGLANVGLTDTDEIVTQASELFKRGVSTSTIGIGDDFNEDLLLPMAQAGGGNGWHVETSEDMQRIFAVELQGLIAQVAHTVTLGLIPADGVRLVDLLNDFEMTDTGRYQLPNLQTGRSLDVVVQLRVPAQVAGAKIRLLDLRLGFTSQQAKSADVIKHPFEVEFDTETRVQRLPLNHDVARTARLLMNARARREAMSHMDDGDYGQALFSIQSAAKATHDACAPFGDNPEVQAEYAALADLQSSLTDRKQDKMSRKKLAYAADARRKGNEPK